MTTSTSGAVASNDDMDKLRERVRLLELAEEGAKEAFGAIVQEKRSLQIEVERLQSLLHSAQGMYRDLAQSMSPAAESVLEERRRQRTVEGRTPELDDKYGQMELPRAAACYALFNTAPTPSIWPWASDWWKPSSDPRRNLVKAGALIVAEIERIDRGAMTSRQAAAAPWLV